MTNSLSCSLSQLDDVVLVSVLGQLDLPGAARLRAALRKADAEQPVAIVVDLNGLATAQPLQLLVLPAPVDFSGRWYPPRLVYGVNDQVRAALGASALTRRLPLFRDQPDALRAARDSEVVQDRVVAAYPSTPAAPGEARRLLADTCRAWQLAELIPAGQLVISELCANVVLHVGSPMTVILIRTPAGLHVVVRDRASAPPALRAPPTDPSAVTGRGLHLIGHLAAGWGYVPTMDGKGVWAVIRSPRGDPTPR